MTKFSRLTSFFILAAGAQTIGPNDNQLNDILKNDNPLNDNQQNDTR
jgi:hypothetical protein